MQFIIPQTKFEAVSSKKCGKNRVLRKDLHWPEILDSGQCFKKRGVRVRKKLYNQEIYDL